MTHQKLKDIAGGQAVLYVEPDSTVAEAVSKMRARGCHSVLVLRDGMPVGIFTSGGFFKHVVDAGRDPKTTRVGDVMTANPRCLSGDCQGIDAIRLMQDEKIRHIVVRGAGDCGYAIVTAADFPQADLSEMKDELEFERRLWEEM